MFTSVALYIILAQCRRFFLWKTELTRQKVLCFIFLSRPHSTTVILFWSIAKINKVGSCVTILCAIVYLHSFIHSLTHLYVIVFMPFYTMLHKIRKLCQISSSLFYFIFLILSFFSSWLIIKQESCQNYIRILTITTPGVLLACGTNSYRPMCHFYNITGSKYHIEKTKPGQALCPYGPKHNSTSVFVGKLLFCIHNIIVVIAGFIQFNVGDFICTINYMKRAPTYKHAMYV